MKYGQIVKKQDPSGREYNVLTLDEKTAFTLADGNVSMSRAERRRAVRQHKKRKQTEAQQARDQQQTKTNKRLKMAGLEVRK